MNKKTLAWTICLVFSLVSGMPAAQAQAAYPAAPVSYPQQQLDQMLAPVALYPDPLLMQVLMAATYPLEVVQAQRFVEARPGLQGDGLARAVAPMPWDPSVKSLVQFPSVLAMMNDRLDWMQQLGQAFLAQQAAVMDTVQQLRERAQVAGSLQSSPQQRVVADEGMIEIVPVDPRVVYVPYYNPVVVYGNWWWPSAPPVVWAPPPRYRPPQYNPGITVGISFSSGIGVMRAAFGDARPDWRQRQVMVTQTRITNVVNNNVTNNVTINRNVTVNQRPVAWHHDARFGGPRPQAARPPQQADARPEAPRGAPQPPRWQAQQARPAAQPAPQVSQASQARQAPQAVPASPAQQRVAQQDQERQQQARQQAAVQTHEVQAQQRQREQQVHEQQRQREQMANDQQRQREQMAHEQRQQQQSQERQVQQRQRQLQEAQMQQAQQAREQQHVVQQQQQRQQQEQMRQHQEQARQQQEHTRREQQARAGRNERQDDGR